MALPLAAQGKFYMTGAVFSPAVHPELTGVAAVAIPLDSAEQNWSYTSYDVTPRKAARAFTFQTSVRTGFATQVKALGRVRLFALIDGGYAQLDNTAGGAVGGGFIASLAVSKTVKLLAAYRILKTSVAAGSPKDFVLAIGRTF
ncbi:MAG: hypothetical protein V4502_07990 [Pseudomonadota bacterium]